MKLTKNERRTLLLMLENGRITDTEVASKLGITKQAVGKIRKKLETTGIIQGYNVKLDYERLGIHAFAITTAVMNKEGLSKGDLEVEKSILDNPHILKAFRVPSGDITHIIIYGFDDLDELTNYFHRRPSEDLDVKQIHVCSHIGFLKDDPKGLLKKSLEDAPSKKYKSRFLEIDRFKKKLEQ